MDNAKFQREWIDPSEYLPHLAEGLTSYTVLFMVKGRVYCGHYHCNGYFYCDESAAGKRQMMAKSPNVVDSNLYTLVEKWCYLETI